MKIKLTAVLLSAILVLAMAACTPPQPAEQPATSGADFGALALEFSDCPSRYEGGELVFRKGVMVQEFEQWSFAADIGDTGIVKTTFGYHVMQMVDRTGFEDADMTEFEIRARTNMFYETYSEMYETVNSDEWEYNHALLDQFSDLLSQSVLPIPDGANIATLGENTVPAIMYAYFFLVYRSDFEQSALMFGYGPDAMEEFWELEQAGVTLRQMLLNEAMSSAKEYAALYRAAVADGMSESETSAASSDERIASLLAQMDDDEQLFFEAYRLTPVQMREVLRQVQLAANYLNRAMATINVTPEAMRAAYDADPDAFDQVTVRHILISSNDSMSEEEQEAARALAEDILARLN